MVAWQLNRRRFFQRLPILIIAVTLFFVSTSLWLNVHLEDVSTKNDMMDSAFSLYLHSYQVVATRDQNKNNEPILDPASQAAVLQDVGKRSTNLPNFILHIGPQKTMSSAIQCVLQDLKPYLQIDEYEFVGKVDARACYPNSPFVPIDSGVEDIFWKDEDGTCVDALLNAYENGHDLSHIECWTTFLGALDKLKAADGTDKKIILSDEKLSEIQMLNWGKAKTTRFWKFLQHQLRNRYHIRIIMVYRRYYEWLMSIKNQGDKYSLGRRNMKLWPPDGPEKEPIFPQLQRWMRNTTEIPSPYTPEMHQVYRHELSLDTVLLNMHNNHDDLLEDFLCTSLVGAVHTCNEYRQAIRNATSTRYRYTSNPSENPFCDQIAYRAYQQGIIRDLRGHRKGADRLFFNEIISRRLAKLNMTRYDLPLVCPSRSEVQQLLDRSLFHEQKFMPEFFQSIDGRPKLEEKFWKDVNQKKFCSVNTTAVLEQEDWIRFLQTQWRPKRGKKPADWEFTTYKITNANFTSE
jgi:hypothetical protein